MGLSDTSSRLDCLDGLWRAVGAPYELEPQMADVWRWHKRKDREQMSTGRVSAVGGEGCQSASLARPTGSREGADSSLVFTEDARPAGPQNVPLMSGDNHISLAKPAYEEELHPAVPQEGQSSPLGSFSAVDVLFSHDSLTKSAHVEDARPVVSQMSVSSLFGETSAAVTVSGKDSDRTPVLADEQSASTAHPTVSYEGGDDAPCSVKDVQPAAPPDSKDSQLRAKAASANKLASHQSLAKSADKPHPEEQGHLGASSVNLLMSHKEVQPRAPLRSVASLFGADSASGDLPSSPQVGV